jgi:hypothetical protein
MSNPNGHGGRRSGAGRPKSKSTLLREAAEQLLRDLLHFRHSRQSGDQVVDELRRLTAAMHRLREDQRSDRENFLPILRRLTEIERHLRLTETPQAPRPSRRHPMGA